MPKIPVSAKRAFANVPKRPGNIIRNRLLLYVLLAVFLILPAGAISSYSVPESNNTYSSRGFNDTDNDTAILDVPTHSEGSFHGFTSQNITVQIVNYNKTWPRAIDVIFTVKDKDSGIFEPMANTSGNISGFNIPALATLEHYLQWDPSHEGNFIINITTGNVSTWADDRNSTNNNMTINVTIENIIDVAAEISNLDDGDTPEMGSFSIEAWINNTGNVNITQDFTVELKILNYTTNSTDFTDTQTILASVVPLNYGEGRLITFSPWSPSTPGRYLINVTTMLPSDGNNNNNISSILLNVTPVYFYDFRVEVDPTEEYAEPGGAPVQISFIIRNIATLTDSYTYHIQSGEGWLMGNNPTTGITGTVVPGGSTTISVQVLVPPGTGFETMDGINITATSIGNSSVFRMNVSYVYTYEINEVVVALAPPGTGGYGDPGEEIDYTFTVTNQGNKGDIFNLELTTSPPKWDAYILAQDEPYETPYIPPGQSETITVTVQIPELVYETRIEDHTYGGAIGYLTLKASSLHTSDSASVITTVNSVTSADIWGNPVWELVDPKPDTQRVDIDLSIRNINNAKQGGMASLDTIDISVQTVRFIANWSGEEFDSERWEASTSKSNVTIGGGEIDSTVRLTIFVPSDPYNGSGYVLVTAMPRDDPLAIPGFVEVFVHVTKVAGVTVTTQEPLLQQGAPTDTLTFSFEVTNTGNGKDTYILEPSSEHNWTTEIVGGERNITPDESLIIQVKITIPPYVPERADEDGTNIGVEDNLTLNATSSFNRTVTDSDNATTKVVQGFSIDLAPDDNSSVVDEGASVTYTVNVTNQGNGDDTVDLVESHSSLPGWSVEFIVSTIFLVKGEMKQVDITVSAGEFASAEVSFPIQIRGTSQGNHTKTDVANITTVVKQVAGIEITLLSPLLQSGFPGDTLTYSFQVKNTGNGNDTFNFTTTSSPYDNWTVLPDKTEETVSPFQSTVVYLEVTVPAIDEGDMKDELQEKGIIAGTVNNISFLVNSNVDKQYKKASYVAAEVMPLYEAGLKAGKTEEDVLPTRAAVYSITVMNMGNGRDNISLINAEEQIHTGSSTLSQSVVNLGPGTSLDITLTVSPNASFSPYIGEKYVNTITAISDSNPGAGRSKKFTTTIVFMKLNAPATGQKNINISGAEKQTVKYDFEIMNVPSAGGSIDQDNFNIKAAPPEGTLDDLADRGWSYALSQGSSTGNKNITISLQKDYAFSEFTLTITASEQPSEIGEDIEIEVTAESDGRPNLDRKILTTTSVVYVDLFFRGELKLNKDSFEEGGTLEVTATLVAIGTVPINNVVVTMYVNDKPVDINNTLGRFALSRSYDDITRTVQFSWKVPSLEWDEKVEEYNIVLKVDEDDVIYETNSEGSIGAEENNEIGGSIMVRDNALNPVISAILLFFSLGGAIFLFKSLNQNRTRYIFYGVFSGILGASLFAMPWDSFGFSASGATTFGKVIIWFFLILVFAATALFISFTSRSYIESLITEKAKKDRLKYEFFSRDESKDVVRRQLIPDNKKYKPYLIACAGAFIQLPIFFLIIGLYSGVSLVFAKSIYGLIYAAVAFAGVIAFIRINLSVYEHITSAEKLIDRIREDTLSEIRLEVQPIEGEKEQGGAPKGETPRRRRPPRGKGPRPGGRPPRRRGRPPGGRRERRRRPPGGDPRG